MRFHYLTQERHVRNILATVNIVYAAMYVKNNIPVEHQGEFCSRFPQGKELTRVLKTIS